MLVEGFHKAGWEVASPKGTMFMWAAIPKTYANSEQFAIALLQKTGVLVTPVSYTHLDVYKRQRLPLVFMQALLSI